MAQSQAVIDFIPAPSGHGAKHDARWWTYVHSRGERDRLDLLLTMALLSRDVETRLLKHDGSLLEQFDFSQQTIHFLRQIDTLTLDEYAAALLSSWPASSA